MYISDPYIRELRQALDMAVEGVSFRDLQQAALRLSKVYRAGTFGATSQGASTYLGALAYAITRMPATLASIRSVLREFRDRSGNVQVKTLLDLGAGPGTTLWAGACELPGLTGATLVEPNREMVAVAKQLLDRTSVFSRLNTNWRVQMEPNSSYDLVIAGYVLTELEPTERILVVENAWKACRKAVVVILPGSVSGFKVLLAVRHQLLKLGATIIAPCPHEDSCPLPDGDWCHFGVRLNRSSLHRKLKGGRLPYEDEKISYLVATRGVGMAAEARVISRPMMMERRVALKLCGVEGLREEMVTRSNRVSYRAARKVGWGGVW